MQEHAQIRRIGEWEGAAMGSGQADSFHNACMEACAGSRRAEIGLFSACNVRMQVEWDPHATGKERPNRRCGSATLAKPRP